MDPKKLSKDFPAGRPAPAAPAAGPKPIEKTVTSLIAELPFLDAKGLDEAIAEAKDRPRASLQYLFDRFTSGDAAARALAARLIARLGGADVIDNLNALIFDAGQDPFTKVMANDLLAALDSPVDPEVFGLSVPDAEELKQKLPSTALALLKTGDTAGAVERARALPPAERWLTMYDAAERQKDAALPFLQALARDDEANATAAAGAVIYAKLAAGVPLLLELQNTGGREFQKLIKRLLFEFRQEGVEIPEEKPKPAPAPAAASPAEADDDDLPLYRCLMSEPSAAGLILVTLARTRPNGRLKVFSVLVDLWKRGIQQAGLRMDMSRSSFDRFVESQSGSKLKMKPAALAEARRTVARGVRVAREFGSPLPFDFGLGRMLLGDLDKEIASIDTPFTCSKCGQPLDAETIAKIRSVAPYENIPAETRCAACRG